MVNQTLSALTRGILAAVALSSVSAVANAGFVNALPDPFLGRSVDLQAASGTLVPLSGVGPGGVTLYANHFLIQNFVFNSFDGVTGTENLTAQFDVDFLDSAGKPVGGNADLPGTFKVQFNGRTTPFEAGTFTTRLLEASFSGTTSLGTPIDVSLANQPTATISIQPHVGGNGYDINYLTSFTIQGQYALNGGAPIAVPPLGDANNGTTTKVSEPLTLALLVPGLLAMAGSRRRRAAAAA
ncbi:MAG: hypothetical protein PHE55_03175 [Methylococcaceae bacterium]|nr:hypothetical protein [Methylococcaceae bacterium]